MSIATLITGGLGTFANIATLVTGGLANYTGLPQPQPAGYQYQACTIAPYSGSGYSLEQGSSPAVVVGDVFITQLVTSPSGFAVTIIGDGTLDIAAGGNTSRQEILYAIYRLASNTIDPSGFPSVTGKVWINEVAPVWNAAVILPTFSSGPITVGATITPVVLQSSAYAVSPPGDTLVFTLASGALPTGLGIVSGQIIGAPSSVQNTFFTLAATDITGTQTISPQCSISVSSPYVPPNPPNPPQPPALSTLQYGPRVWGRTNNGVAPYTWVAVTPDANGSQSYLNITWLIQVLKLNLAESPIYSNYGIPAQQSVVTQIFPDFYVQSVQSQFSQFFSSLQITRNYADPQPYYNVNLVTFEGTVFQENIYV